MLVSLDCVRISRSSPNFSLLRINNPAMFSGGTSTPTAASKRPHTRASAAVRRSQSRAGSLAPSLGGTPVPERTRRAAGKSSALATRALTASYAGSEIGGNEEDVEGLQSQGVLLKTESHAVSVLGVGLPAEVQQVLNDSGQPVPNA